MHRPFTNSSSSEEDSDLEHTALIITGIIIHCIKEAQARCAERHHEHRRYLTRPELLLNPRDATPWQVLYDSKSDWGYITTMGVNCATFKYILASGFAQGWDMSAIPHHDTDPHGIPRLGRCSLAAEGALGLIFHYLCLSMTDTGLQQIFALVPSTIIQYHEFGMQLLHDTLCHMPAASIPWWRTEEVCELDNQLIITRHPLLTGTIGSINGLNVAVGASNDPELENATYNGWLHDHSVSCVMTFSPRGIITYAVLNAPGSWHDAKVACPIYDLLLKSTPEGYDLIADTAFPRRMDSIQGCICAPIKSGQHLPSDEQEHDDLIASCNQLLSYHQTAEWGMRALRGSFVQLWCPLDINNLDGRADLLKLCVRVNNIRAVLVGINQIQNVYMPIWKEAEDAEVWENFENMIFGEL